MTISSWLRCFKIEGNEEPDHSILKTFTNAKIIKIYDYISFKNFQKS